MNRARKDYDAQIDPKPVLKPDLLYSGDNGHLFCGAHAGQSAKYTGRDISGQKVHVVTVEDVAEARRKYEVELRCERCGMQPRLVVLA